MLARLARARVKCSRACSRVISAGNVSYVLKNDNLYIFICQTLKSLRFAQRKVMSGIPSMMVKWAMSDARLAAGGFGSQVTVARGMA